MKKLSNLLMAAIIAVSLGAAAGTLSACGGPEIKPAQPDGRPAMRERYKEEHRDLDRVMRDERDDQ